MKGLLKREDDFSTRREHVKNLTDEQLKERFWDLIEEIVDPLLNLAKENTTPSIERSVLLRMGFSSLEAKPLVELAMDHGLIGFGVGHVVYRVAKDNNMEIVAAGREMIEGKHWQQAVEIFKGGAR